MSGDTETSNTLNISPEAAKERSDTEERLVDSLQSMMDSSFAGLGESSNLPLLSKLDSPSLQPDTKAAKNIAMNPGIEEKKETGIVTDTLDDNLTTKSEPQDEVIDKKTSKDKFEEKEKSQIAAGNTETREKAPEKEIVPPSTSTSNSETTESLVVEGFDSIIEKTKVVVNPDSDKGIKSHDIKTSQENKNLEESTKIKPDVNFNDEFGMTEQEALAFLKEEEDAKKAAAGSGPPKIQIYGSSVSGNMRIKKAQNKILDTLDRFNIEYEFIDLAADDDAKLFIKRKNPNSTAIPQLYLNGEFRMEIAEFDELLEYDELFEALGVDPDF